MTAAGAGAITGMGSIIGMGFLVRETVGLTFGMPEEYARVASGNKARSRFNEARRAGVCRFAPIQGHITSYWSTL
jgi:hypothetical protein